MFASKRRRMVYVPDLNPHTFLFFFEKGSTGYSWSLRDYSRPQNCVLRYAREFSLSAAEVEARARYSIDAPTVDTGNLEFWHHFTLECNSRYLGSVGLPIGSLPIEALPIEASLEPTLPAASPAGQADAAEFPVLCRDRFNTLAKAFKREDLNRMLNSPRSEDWVTWNMFQLLLSQQTDAWWVWMQDAARARNPELLLPELTGAAPEVELWCVVPPPPAYEAASRERMRRSDNARWVARSHDPKAVEGQSEIDIVLRHERALVYIEAKLGSDVALSTTYDPARNQITRNIDCLLEAVGERMPIFWMLAKDDGAGRAYSQLMHQYRTRPETLAAELPHRDPASVGMVARNLAILLWTDFAPALVPQESDTEETAAVKRELIRRIS
jgi:hypothetical protein